MVRIDVFSKHGYYVMKRMSLNGQPVLMKYGPIHLTYQVDKNGKPADKFGEYVVDMDAGILNDINTIGTDRNGITRGVYVCRACFKPMIENNTEIIYVNPENYNKETKIWLIDRLLKQRCFEMNHDRHAIKIPTDWYNVSSLNCNFDLCPNLIEARDKVEDILINVRADFVAIQHVMTPIAFVRHFIYKIKVSSSDHMSTETKIIEIDEENLKCLKEDPIGYVIYHNIFNVGDVIPVNYKL